MRGSLHDSGSSVRGKILFPSMRLSVFLNGGKVCPWRPIFPIKRIHCDGELEQFLFCQKITRGVGLSCTLLQISSYEWSATSMLLFLTCQFGIFFSPLSNQMLGIKISPRDENPDCRQLLWLLLPI